MLHFGKPLPKPKTISNNHTLSGLVKQYKTAYKKQKELKRQLKHKDTQLKELYNIIKAVEPSYQLEKETAMPYRTKRKWFEMGECKRLCMDVLRNSDKDLTITEITEQIVIEKGFDFSFEEQNTINSLYKTVSNSIRRLKEQEYIQITANVHTASQNRTYRILKENGLYLVRAS